MSRLYTVDAKTYYRTLTDEQLQETLQNLYNNNTQVDPALTKEVERRLASALKLKLGAALALGAAATGYSLYSKRKKRTRKPKKPAPKKKKRKK